jgi:hypothetical protein
VRARLLSRCCDRSAACTEDAAFCVVWQRKLYPALYRELDRQAIAKAAPVVVSVSTSGDNRSSLEERSVSDAVAALMSPVMAMNLNSTESIDELHAGLDGDAIGDGVEQGSGDKVISPAAQVSFGAGSPQSPAVRVGGAVRTSPLASMSKTLSASQSLPRLLTTPRDATVRPATSASSLGATIAMSRPPPLPLPHPAVGGSAGGGGRPDRASSGIAVDKDKDKDKGRQISQIIRELGKLRRDDRRKRRTMGARVTAREKASLQAFGLAGGDGGGSGGDDDPGAADSKLGAGVDGDDAAETLRSMLTQRWSDGTSVAPKYLTSRSKNVRLEEMTWDQRVVTLLRAGLVAQDASLAALTPRSRVSMLCQKV